ncbi:MAG: flavodoxin family protein [Defluviitaleaceae bacterium]|nr:flavodoxin family protein [Defluviitaleaceae bacterium]MCL2263129.1 flavodoxin family protein [Defluviitaleaceae bacterium]
MKILVINGSPKDEQSNTMVLTRAFLDGAGWSDAEIISVSKQKIENCIGCFGCWRDTPGECVIKDDMDEILPKLIAADVIIWSFPLYYYSVPGGLKTLIDRQLPMNLPEMTPGTESGDHPYRYDLSHQRHIVISGCGFWTHKGNYDAVVAMFSRMDVDTFIFCGQGELFQAVNMKEMPQGVQMGADEWEGLKSLLHSHLAIIARAGKEFAAGEIKPKTLAELEKSVLPQEVYEQGATS